MPSLTLLRLPLCKYNCKCDFTVTKERLRVSHAKRVCRALLDLYLSLMWPVLLLLLVISYATFSSPYYSVIYNVDLSNDCKVLSEMRMDLISQFYHLYEAYYVKVLETDSKSGTIQVCILKTLLTNTSIVFEHVPSDESPLCDHCRPSMCCHDNYLGLSLLYPNQSIVNYIILDIGANKVYQKNLTDLPQSVRDVWADMIPGYRTFSSLGLACCLIGLFINSSIMLVIHCPYLLRRIYHKCCRRLWHRCSTHIPSAVSEIPTGDYSPTDGLVGDHGRKGLAACCCGRPNSAIGLTNHREEVLREAVRNPSLVSAGSSDFNLSRTSSTSTISAKSEKGYLRQSELVGSHAVGQQCSGSPTKKSPVQGGSSSETLSLTSLISAKSEQGRDLGALALSAQNQLFTVKRTVDNSKMSSAPVYPQWTDQQQTMLQDLDELVVLKVAAEWEILAVHLGVEPGLIDIIKKSTFYQCEDSCHEMFVRWISKEKGTGGQPRTWYSVVWAIRRMGLGDLADALSERYTLPEY